MLLRRTFSSRFRSGGSLLSWSSIGSVRTIVSGSGTSGVPAPSLQSALFGLHSGGASMSSLTSRMQRTLGTKPLSILMLVSADNIVAQRVRMQLQRLYGEGGVSVELALSADHVEAAVASHEPDLILCPVITAKDTDSLLHAARAVSGVPCLEVRLGSGCGSGRGEQEVMVVEVAEDTPSAPPAVWSTQLLANTVPDAGTATDLIGDDGLGLTAAQVYRRHVADAVVAATSVAVDSFAKGWEPVPDGDVAALSLDSSLSCHPAPEALLRGAAGIDVDLFANNADAIVRTVRAADSSSGGIHTVVGGTTLAVYGAHVASAADVAAAGSATAPVGSVLAYRPNGSVLVKCADGGVWIRRAQAADDDAAIKVPATKVVPADVLAGVPELDSPALVVDAPPTDGTDIWATVTASGVAHLHFDFYNGAVTAKSARRLAAAFTELSSRDDVQVVVLRGGSDFFCTGLDATVLAAADDFKAATLENMEAMNDLVKTIAQNTDVVTVSALQGDPAASGAMASCAADQVWAHTNVVLNPHYQQLGLTGSDYRTYTLPKRVGAPMAEWLTTSMQPVSATAAAGIGLVDELLCSSRDEFASTVEAKADALAMDPVAVSQLLSDKRAQLDNGGLAAMERARAHEMIVARDNVRNPAFEASLLEFVHKVPPVETPLHLPGTRRRHGRVLDGKGLASKKLKSLKSMITDHKAAAASVPKLAVLLVGDRPDSKKYVQHKIKACKRVGMESLVEVVDPTVFGDSATLGADLTDALVHRVRNLNDDPSVNGIIVQLPLPPGIDTQRVLAEISTHKDVDGFGVEHLGALAGGVSKAAAASAGAGGGSADSMEPTDAPRHRTLVPCTAAGILELLDHYHIPMSGKQVVIVGRSPIVGMPSQLLFMARNATVNACDIHTRDLPARVSDADILVAAAGSAELIKKEWVKKGAVVVDVGINFKNGKMVGDVEASAMERAAFQSPVPGGVGPMTVAMLMENTVQSWADTHALPW